MKSQFIETNNTRKFVEICDEMMDVNSLIGPSLAMITGPAGRGKSEAAKHFAVHSTAIYIQPMVSRSWPMLLREICFELGGIQPQRSDTCLSVIGDEMAKERRLILIDEADLLKMEILEGLRNINERYACPIIFIGETRLQRRIESRRRLSSRMRKRLEFTPVTQQDVSYFFKRCLDLKLSVDVIAAIHKRSGGDWRSVLMAAIGVERMLKASGLNEITLEMVMNVIKNS
jgi:DNA transposition AAA+ family ATPase